MKILIALDRTEYAEIVLEHGLDHAARHDDVELHLVTVVEGDNFGDAREWLEMTSRDAIDAFGLADRPVRYHLRRGSPADVIATVAAELAVDLLVVGRFHVPSAADAVLELVECPTLVVGIDGPVLEPQCPDCVAVRRDTDGEALFCDAHQSDRLPDLVTRVSPVVPVHLGSW